jgi:hypothetical protein
VLRLGIDVGSVTVKLALLGPDDAVVFWTYRRHRGRPLEAPWKTCAATVPHPGTCARPSVARGDTASGAPRILEQQMNDLCAAGTGAFVEQQAEGLGIPIERFGDEAIAEAARSRRPVDLGSRCTVFMMESDLVHHQQTGALREDLVAGLCYSVVRNFPDKVVAGRPTGGRALLLGGVAHNASVVAAMQATLGTTVVVPEHHATSAAIGMALTARDAAGSVAESRFRGLGERVGRHAVSSRHCRDCANACRITQVDVDGARHCYGGVCGKHDGRPRAAAPENLFDAREALLLSCLEPGGGDGRAGRIGIPRALLFYEYFPLWCTFLQELGLEVVASDPTDRRVVRVGLERSLVDNCYASRLVTGHVHNLVEKGVDRVFFPWVIEFERRVKDLERNYACPLVQSLPAVLGRVPGVELIRPVFLRDRGEREWRRTLRELGAQLGRPSALVRRAVRRAADAQAEFGARLVQLGRERLRTAPADAPRVVVLGTPYGVCDPALNLNIARKLAQAGAVPIP